MTAENEPLRSPDRAVIAGTVAERTRKKLSTLSHSELKVARALLAAYPAAGLETVAQFAQRASVSAPTVLRFTVQLGFRSYRTFQEALIREVHEQMGSPLRQLTAADDSSENPAATSSPAQHYAEVLASTFETLPDTEFARATAMLSDPRMRLHLLGGRFSQVLAQYLSSHLVLVRSSVRGVPVAEPERTTMLLDLGQRDVLVLFDYRRYDQDLLVFARDAAARGAHIVLFTDPWMSPIAAVADIVLPARVEAPSPFDSLVPAMAVVETVVAAVTERLGEAARTRLGAIESLSQRCADE